MQKTTEIEIDATVLDWARKEAARRGKSLDGMTEELLGELRKAEERIAKGGSDALGD